MGELGITFKEFHNKVDEGFNPLIFDVRSRDEAEKGNITDYFDLPYINTPYFEMLKESESDDYLQVLKDYINDHLQDKLQKETPIVVVCAKVGTSEMMRDVLNDLGYQAQSIEGGMKEWGRYYEDKTVVDSEELKIIQIVRLARGCLGYICISKGEAIVIDPSHHLDIYHEILKENNATLKYVIDTHVHADHISGGKKLSEQTNAHYLLHPYDAIHPIDMLPATFTYDYLWDTFTLEFGSAHLKSIHVPGHTLGNMAYLVNDKYLFTGDTIFIDSIARPDLGGQGEAWAPIHHASLQKLLSLDDETLILPAHFSTTEEQREDGIFAQTLGTLKNTNEDLKMASKPEDEFVKFILSSLPDFPEEYIEIKRVNLGISFPDEEQAYELEVGKNLCALEHKQEVKN